MIKPENLEHKFVKP